MTSGHERRVVSPHTRGRMPRAAFCLTHMMPRLTLMDGLPEGMEAHTEVAAAMTPGRKVGENLV